MLLAGILNQSCTLHVAGVETVNDYGDPVRTYTEIETVCSLQQQTRREPGGMGELSVSDWRLYLPPDVDLGDAPTASRATVDGQEYEFVGAPWRVWDPVTERTSHLEATVRQAGWSKPAPASEPGDGGDGGGDGGDGGEP